MVEYEMVKVFNLAATPANIQATAALQALKGRGEDIGSLLEVQIGQNAIAGGGHAMPLVDQWMLSEGAQVGETVFLVWNAAIMAGLAVKAHVS